jgi:molybdopterin/thiamine biosynthesis adenylyltransferase
MLSAEELERYKRQIMIQGLGEEGQEKLKRARVFLAGVGGLGSPAALYLAAAGVGNLRIVDSDVVELTNLNRQILHWTKDVGRNKVDSAGSKLRELNPQVNVETIKERISEDNVRDLLSGYDLIVDAMDNLPTRYLLNQAAMEKKIPLFHGAIRGFEGRAMTIIPGKTACLMCIYQGVNISEKVPVIGVTPAIIASIQATEAIKYITGIGQLLTNRFLVYDGLNMRFTEVRVSRNPACKHCSSC